MNSSVSQALSVVVLAAGLGSRLQSVQAAGPKGLVEVGQGPVLGRSLSLLIEAGITDIVLVGGWKKEAYQTFLNEHFPSVRMANNPAYATTGSLASLLIGVKEITGDALVVESDLLYERRALKHLLAAPERDTLLASGFTSSDDEVWVYAREARLVHLSKTEHDSAPCVGELVGLTRLSRSVLAHLAELAPALPVEANYEDGLNAICATHPISVCKIDDLRWCEIDTPDHLARAREQVWPSIHASEKLNTILDANAAT